MALNFNPSFFRRPIPTGNRMMPTDFGRNINLSGPPAPIIQPEPQQPDFVSEYDKITSNRPNRLAYQEAINQGPPQIERSKWARLGAALAAGAAGAGGADPTSATNLGISSYFMPQMRSDEKYRERVSNLERLAQFEESDVANKVRALEMQRGEYWKGREDKRQDEQLRLQRKTTDAQIANWEADNERQNWTTRTDPKTGIAYHHNLKTGVEKVIGQAALSSAEALEKELNEFIQKEIAKSPFEDARTEAANRQKMREIGAQGANALAVAREATARAEANQKAINARDAARVAARLRESAGKLKPGDIYGHVQLDIAQAISDEKLPASAAGYLKQENGVPVADAGFTGDAEIEKQLREFIGQSIARHRAGQAPGAASTVKKDPLGIR